jgi:3-hydroxybutyryl-CoA dehydratase
MTGREFRVKGMYFEDLKVGDSMASPGRTITETDLVNFCGLSGDYNELHSNEEYASRSAFGKRIAHGMLGLSIASGLASRLGFLEGTAEAFMGLEWRLKHPIFAGDTVHLHADVVNKREIPRLHGGLVHIDVQVLNQRDEVVQEGQWTLLLKGRPAA